MPVERSVVVRLRAEYQAFVAGMGRAGLSVRELRSEIDKASKTDKGRAALNDLAMSAASAGTAMVAGFAAAVAASARFEKQMSEVGAVAGANAAQLDQLSEAALRAGEDTVFSATEAAKAEAELAKAGLTTSEILGGALSGSLDLAAAGSLDLAEAADIAAKAMRMFHLTGGDIDDVADTLSAAANKSATDVHELGEALKMGGLAASSAGMDFDQTVGVLAAFADRALVGSDAGTSLKTMLTFLANPTEKATNAMRELGLEVYDSNGQFIGAERLAGRLQATLSGLTQQERQAAVATIFGADAQRAATVLYELGADGVREYITAVDDQGAASDVAAAKTDNLMGDIERLTGSIETLAIRSGDASAGGLRVMVRMLDSLVAQVGAMPPVVTGGAAALLGMTGATVLAAAAAVRMRTAAANMAESLAEVGPRAAAAGRGLQVATRWAGRAVVVFTALQVASAVAASMGRHAPDVDMMADSLERLSDKGERSGEVTRIFGRDLDRLASNINFLREGLDNAETAAAWENFFGLGGFGFSHAKRLEEIQALDAALAQMVQGGKAKDAADALAKLGLSAQQSSEFLPGYTQAVAELAAATDPAAVSIQEAADTSRTLAATWEDAYRTGKSLSEVMAELNGEAVTWARAEINIEDAARRMAKALKDSGGSLDVTTEAGAAAKTAMLDYAEAIGVALDAKLAESGSLVETSELYDQYRARLVRTLDQMGLTRSAAEALADEYLRMPTDVNTNVRMTPLGPPIGSVTAIARRIRDQAQAWLDDHGVRVRVGDPSGAVGAGGGALEGNRWGGIDYAMARGGTLGAFIADSPTVLMGERATRREAYIPEHGDHARNLRTLTTAAAWEGQRLVPAGQAGPAALARELRAAFGGGASPAVVNVYIGGEPLDARVDYRVEQILDATAAAAMSGARA